MYSVGYQGGGGYTFVLNADTGQVCELNLGGWAAVAHWSSDGRYLAVERATSSHPADLAILDTITGKLTTFVGVDQGTQGQLYVDDFTWAPDNYHLLAIGSIASQPSNSQNTSDTHGLYLADIGLGKGIYVDEYKSIVSSQDNNLAWSADGSNLLVRCPTQTSDRICIMSVQETGQ